MHDWLRRVLVVLGILWAISLLQQLFIAFAQADSGGDVVTPAGTAASAFDTASIATYVVGVFLPLVVAYITKESWKSWVKGVILLALASLSSIISQWIDAHSNHTAFAWQSVVLTALLTFGVGVLSHKGAWGAGNSGGLATTVQRRLGVKD